MIIVQFFKSNTLDLIKNLIRNYTVFIEQKINNTESPSDIEFVSSKW
jgi:hypothetical protein